MWVAWKTRTLNYPTHYQCVQSIKIKSYNDINFVRSGHLFDDSLEKARS